MRNYYNQFDNKTIINCIYCLNKLRVPFDKGKISVFCPVCEKEFIYNPNSIPDTFKQVILSAKSRLPRERKKRVVIFILVLIALAVLLFVFFNTGKPKFKIKSPGFTVTAPYIKHLIS